jgi:hypothetical protein
VDFGRSAVELPSTKTLPPTLECIVRVRSSVITSINELITRYHSRVLNIGGGGVSKRWREEV